MKMVTRSILVGLALLAITSPVTAQDAAPCAKPGKSLEAIASTIRLAPYPPMSMRLGEQGITIVSVAIGQDGVPTDVTVAKSSGNSRLDNAAIAEVKTDWRWQPPLEDCKPTTANTLVSLGFHIGPLPHPDVAITVTEKAYPPAAIDRLEQGDTYLNLTLGDGGVVKEVYIAFSSNYRDLDEQAAAVMKDSSTRIAGKPAGHLIILVRWKLPARMNVTQTAENIGTIITGGGFSSSGR